MNPNYVDTVRLLLAIAPAVFGSGRFAMKGGTALNLFVKEMPRLSVDLDLVFVDHRPDRKAALQAIAQEPADDGLGYGEGCSFFTLRRVTTSPPRRNSSR